MSTTNPSGVLTRRRMLQAAAAAAIGAPLLDISTLARARAGSGDPGGKAGVFPSEKSLIERIERSVIFPGRNGSNDWSWFHPRACMTPGTPGPTAFMTMQSIAGSDYFGPVQWTVSTDLGKTWSPPRPVPGMGRTPGSREGRSTGVCDLVPEYHPQTNTVLAIGHNVHYEKGRFFQEQDPRWPVYSIRDAQGHWSSLQKLEWDDPRASLIHTCGCCQRVTLPDGDVLVPLTFAPKGRVNRLVTTVRCAFDGKTLTIRKVGSTLELPGRRGLLEPSLTTLDGRFYLTLRAEDGHGHVTTSDDGLNWAPIQPWAWENGEPLVMSTTQQHWLTHSEGLYLVYTRKTPENTQVVRWRSPLLLAEVNRKTMRLKRQTEQTVLPLIGDGVKDGKNVARMGNFHVTNATPDESWVTVGEARPTRRYRGDTLLARIRWTRPNRLVVE